MATYRDNDVVQTMLAEAPGADADPQEASMFEELLHTKFPGISEEQFTRCLMAMLIEALRREKEAEATARSFAEEAERELDLRLLRGLAEFFIYAHQGRAPSNLRELMFWMDSPLSPSTRLGEALCH
jgi:hypothetical protein